MQRAPITISEVAKEIRLHVPLRKEFLIAAETGLAGRKELFVDLGLVEAGHGPAVEPQRARGHHQVRALQGRSGLRLPTRRSGLAEHDLGRILQVGHYQKPA